MKKPLFLILVLMSLCVTGIIGLQLFWNLQNYRTTVRAFDHDINEALTNAVARETEHRQDQIVERFKGWLADTSLVIITADHNNRDSSTVFYTRDTHPKYKEDEKRKAQFGLTDFKEKLDHITPAAKDFMIRHFGDRVLKRDLKEGIVYHYTQMLGDSLEKAFNASKADPLTLATYLRSELGKKNIRASFKINPAKKSGLYLTRPVNTNFRKPFKNDWVVAGFESPDRYFLSEMRWVIITSLLLIAITIGCFAYTVKTLLSQQKLAELKDDLVNNITHELNTPISSIKITAEALKSFPHGPERQSEYLEIISYQADKLGDLSTQILRSSKLGKTKPLKKRVNLHELIGAALQELNVQIAAGKAIIHYAPTAEIYTTGDPEALRHLLVNLLDNALKYNRRQPVIKIQLRTAKPMALIRINDNGIGIPPEYQAMVFDQFFRVPQGNLHDVKGFGLGLNYVKEVIRQHKGNILLDSGPAGSTFTIQLPLADE